MIKVHIYRHRLCVLRLSLLIMICNWGTLGAESPASGEASDKLFSAAVAALGHNNPREAVRILEKLDGAFGSGNNSDAYWRAQEMKFQALGMCLAKPGNDESADKTIADRYRKQFEIIKQGAISRPIDLPPKAQVQDAALRAARLQRVTTDYAETLLYAGLGKEASEAFQVACKSFADSRSLLEMSVERSGLGPDGVMRRSAMPLWQREGLISLEKMRLDAIGAAEAWMSSTGGNEAKEAVLHALDEFVAEFPDSPWAGTKMSRCMRLRGNFDLNRLVATYAKCRDKNDPQYIYSTLGLAGLLNEAGRYLEALTYLRWIETNGVPPGRMAEFNYTMGVALENIGDDPGALKYFKAAQQLGKDFDVEPAIRRIVKRQEQSAREALDSPAFQVPADIVRKSETQPTSGPISTTHQVPAQKREASGAAADGKQVQGKFPMMVAIAGAGVVIALIILASAVRVSRRARR